MPVCNKSLKKAGAAAALTLLALSAFAQSVPNPAMPQMPAMPSMPAIGGSFYTPSFPSGANNPVKKDTAVKNPEAPKQPVLSDATTTEDLITNFINSNSMLSAQDISTLYDSGMFNNISSLNGNASSVSTNALLQQILTSLEDLKTQQKNATPQEKQTLKNTQMDSKTFKQREPSILRFRINGYDIKDSLTTVFFSETEPDGTFLLTGDRRYFTNQKARSETFYILFKAVKSNGSSTTYEVQPRIVQDAANENSYVYRMAKMKGMKAEKTGNLVVLHSDDDNLTIDLLLDIDC